MMLEGDLKLSSEVKTEKWCSDLLRINAENWGTRQFQTSFAGVSYLLLDYNWLILQPTLLAQRTLGLKFASCQTPLQWAPFKCRAASAMTFVLLYTFPCLFPFSVTVRIPDILNTLKKRRNKKFRFIIVYQYETKRKYLSDTNIL